MRFSSFFAGAVALLLALNLSAQHSDHTGPCGTSREALDAITGQLLQNLAYLDEHPVDLRGGSTIYVPIKFHVVRRSDGTGGVDLESILEMMCGLNEFYEPLNIQFFIKGGFNFINNNNLFDNPQSNAGTTLMNNARLNGFLNIFLTDQTGEASTLGYYTPGFPLWTSDYIVVRRSEVGYRRNTIEHEIGHYFAILHTFNGWECDPYSAAKHGNPLTITTAPCNSLKPPYNYPQVELADGSNGAASGDFLADTPADYNLGLGWQGCNYTGGATDKNGVPLDPDEQNIMGYFLQCQNYYFSPGQQQLILTDLNSRRILNTNSTRYLNTNTAPITEPNGPVAAIHPPNNGFSNGKVNVKLEWASGDGATNYIVRIDRFTSFKFQPRYYYVTSPEITLDFTLGNSGKYYWQVYAYNDYNTCPVWGEIFSFTVSEATSIASMPGLEAVAVLPQPLSVGQELSLQLVLENSLTFDMEVLDLNGRLLHREKGISLPSGDHRFRSQWVPEHPGVFLVRIGNGAGQYTEKLLVH